MRPRNIVLVTVRGALLGLLAAALSGCVLATVRTISEDKEAKQGFTGEAYVAEIWESKVLPAYDEQAEDLSTLLQAIAQDEAAAIKQYGHRSGTGSYSFMVRGEAKVVALDTTSRSGIITLDLVPPDGTVDASMVIGPLIKVSQRSAVRDAVGFIQYGAFTNQQEFADVATAMGDRIIPMIAEALGVDDVEAIREMDPAQIEGKTVQFIGAFSLDNASAITIVPVRLTVVEA
ncbi:MAG: DUF2291 domain-containing protein [Anaerolineae bacterium]|nr:DUF2291 domain-containing protein [Anaerolineae bacterium]